MDGSIPAIFTHIYFFLKSNNFTIKLKGKDIKYNKMAKEPVPFCVAHVNPESNCRLMTSTKIRAMSHSAISSRIRKR